MGGFTSYSAMNQWAQNRTFLPVIEVSCSTSQQLSSAIHEDFPKAARWSFRKARCVALCAVSNAVLPFFPAGQHLNTPVQADRWAVLWTRTLQLQERTARPAGSRQIPGWQRGESGHRGTEITWAGHTCTLLLIYLKDMVCKLKYLNCRSPRKLGCVFSSYVRYFWFLSLGKSVFVSFCIALFVLIVINLSLFHRAKDDSARSGLFSAYSNWC